MVSIKSFFNSAILAANIPKKVNKPYHETFEDYHVVVETPEVIEITTAPKKPLNLWSPWAAKCKPLPPMTEREIANQKKFENDHEMDALNFWAPWAAKCICPR